MVDHARGRGGQKEEVGVMAEAEGAFAGDKKTGQSILHGPEGKLRDGLIRFVPRGVETYHLTMMTLLWCVLVVLFSWFACYDMRWLWGASLAIVGQYVTDLLDGAIGRKRDTGLVKWGFYMDHFLDYMFLCSMMIGYALLLPPESRVLMFFTMAIFSAYMVNSFLQFAATNEFQIAYMGIGPTEMRIAFILLNAILIFSEGAALKLMPVILWLATFGLIVTAFRTQKMLWDIDMRAQIAAGKPLPKPDSEGIFVRRAIVSFVLVSLAFGVAVGRVFEPLHRVLGITLYVISWLPLADAFRRTRNPGSHVAPWQDHVFQIRIFVISAVILLVLGWAAFTLAPPVREGTYDARQIREYVADDLRDVAARWEAFGTQLTDLEAVVHSLPKDTPADDLREALQEPIHEVCMSMSAFAQDATHYSTFAHVDMTDAPTDHADAFLVAYASFVAKYRGVARLVPLVDADPRIGKLVSECMLAAVGSEKSPVQLAVALLRPDQLVRLGGGTTYIRMLENEWKRELKDTERAALRGKLKDAVREEASSLSDAIRDNRDAFLFPASGE